MLTNGVVSWFSKQQVTVTLLMYEAKYMLMSETKKEVIWFSHFLIKLGFDFNKLMLLKENNQGVIALTLNPEFYH